MEDGQDCARMKPRLAIARAPPDSRGGNAPDELRDANPTWQRQKRGDHWRYNHADRDQIWVYAAPFRGTLAGYDGPHQ